MLSHRRKRTGPREEGNTLVLSVVLSAVAVALVLTLATITQLQIERKRLLALTDAAALHAAAALDEAEYFTTPGAEVPLTDTTVRRAVEEFLARTPARQRARLRGLGAGSPTAALNNDTAQVTLSAVLRPGYIPWSVVPMEGFRIEVTSTARAE